MENLFLLLLSIHRMCSHQYHRYQNHVDTYQEYYVFPYLLVTEDELRKVQVCG